MVFRILAAREGNQHSNQNFIPIDDRMIGSPREHKREIIVWKDCQTLKVDQELKSKMERFTDWSSVVAKYFPNRRTVVARRYVRFGPKAQAVRNKSSQPVS